MRLCILVSVGMAAIGALSGPVRAEFIVAPNNLATFEGNSANAFPFGSSIPTQRFQQVYAASQFASLGGPILITQIAFRPDAQFGQPAFSFTVPDIQINLSTTGATPDALSTTFASNVGADDTVVVPRGSLDFSSASTGPAEGPKDFDILINLVHPFRYDPTAGDLLLDVRRFASAFDSPFQQIAFDYENTAGDSVSRVFTIASTSGGVNSPVGLADPPGGAFPSGGLVTRFTATAVPEPASVVMFGVGALAVTSCALRCRSRAGAKPANPDIPAMS